MMRTSYNRHDRRKGRFATPFALLTLSAVLAVLLLPSSSAQIVERPIPDDPVKIDSGLVAGKLLASGVRAYLGIPYAEPPVRELRWRDPQPVKPWEGVYNADRKPHMCMQWMRAHDLNHYFGEEAPSEDCLYLNLWAPADAEPGQDLPVIVWIYGGGFTQGTANLANYDGGQIAKKGVVYVAMNYRVGSFGFMAHPDLNGENERGTSGNWGLLDQNAALRWVQRNIAQFGGNPNDVTIMGQSAGGASVSFQQSTPLSKGLIHRVFGMSASAVVPGRGRTSTLEDGLQAGLEFQKLLGADSLQAMRNIPSDRLLAAQSEPGAPRFQPVVDNYFLPAMPIEIFKQGNQSDVPTMLTFMADESRLSLRNATNVEEYRTMAADLYGDAVDEFLKLYPVSSDADVPVMAEKAAREGGMETTMRAWALAQKETGDAPVYMTMFSRVHPYVEGVHFSDHNPETVGAYHTGEVPYYLQTMDAYNMFRPTRNWTAYDRDLSDKVSDCLITFAKTGSPSTDAVQWPEYDPNDEKFIEFGDEIRIVDMNTEGLDFFYEQMSLDRPTQAPGPPPDPRTVRD